MEFFDQYTAIAATVILLLMIFRTKSRTRPAASKWLANHISFINYKIKIGGSFTMVQAKVDQKFGVTWPSPVDKYGNATEVENVTFASDDESLATIEADTATGPYSAIVHTNGTPGATAVRIKADPKIGEETAEIEGSLAVEIVSGEATGFGDPTNTTPVDDEDDN